MTSNIARLSPARDSVRDARIDLAAAYRLANLFGYDDGIWNHFTLALPGEDRFLVKPHGLLMSEVTASNLIVVAADGAVLEGDGFVERTGFCIHSRIHALIPEARCVIHAHPPHATWLADCHDARLEMIDQDSLRFLDRVAYDDAYQGLALDETEGERMARAFAGKTILLSRNHGLTVVAVTVAEAFHDFHYFEYACVRQYRVAVSGYQPAPMPKHVLDRIRGNAKPSGPDDSARLLFDALKRQLDRDSPGYAT
jgi:ribulose-5-phosphate 4-epimerase/fuculose-1-phosphate aldolase